MIIVTNCKNRCYWWVRSRMWWSRKSHKNSHWSRWKRLRQRVKTSQKLLIWEYSLNPLYSRSCFFHSLFFFFLCRWFLEKVYVTNPLTKTQWVFLCGRWLDKSEDDGQTVRELVPAAADGAASQPRMFPSLLPFPPPSSFHASSSLSLFLKYKIWKCTAAAPPLSLSPFLFCVKIINQFFGSSRA